jgi:hypothetical protein
MAWQSPQRLGDVEVPALLGEEGTRPSDTTRIAVYSWAIPRLPGSNTGHGQVWKRPDGLVEPCGGPFKCGDCTDDNALVGELLVSIDNAPYRNVALPQRLHAWG